MVAYVMAHGSYKDDVEVVVPEGLTISFMASAELAGLEHIQYAQLIVGGVAAADTFVAPTPIPNYHFEALDAAWIKRAGEVNIHGLDLRFAGTAPLTALCTATGHGPADHTPECGLLGMALDEGLDHLHFMTCRVDTRKPGPRQGDRNLYLDGVADPSWDRELRDWTAWFIGLDFTEQVRAWEEYADQRLQLIGDTELQDFELAYQAWQVFNQNGATQPFLVHFDGLAPHIQERLLREVPEITAALFDGRLPPEAYADAERFLTLPPDDQDAEWRGKPLNQRDHFFAIKETNDWTQAFMAREYLSYGITEDTFRRYCAKLDGDVIAILATYDRPRQILWS